MEEQFVNSIVGHQSMFKGDVELDGLLRIDGDFQGSVKTSGKVLVGSQGRADCTIDARVVVIGGIMKGTVYASEKVVLLSSAVVLATIYSPRLIAEGGVILEGGLMITGVRPDLHGVATEEHDSIPRFLKRRNIIRKKSEPAEQPERNTIRS